MESGWSIGSYAFQGCTALKNLTLPSNLLYIYEFAFEGCTSLETLNVPGNVSKIDNSAFSGCTALKSVSLPLSLKTVGNAAFRYCTGLTDVYYEGDSVQRGEISIAPYNEPLTGATFHMKEHVHSFGSPVVTAPTCTEDGYTGDVECSVCHEKISTGEVIKATGHHYDGNTCPDCGATRSTADTIRAWF